MGDDIFADAIETMLDRDADVEHRIMAARTLGPSDQQGCLDALLTVCKDEGCDGELSRNAAKSLKRVAIAMDREDAIEEETLSDAAAAEYEANAA